MGILGNIIGSKLSFDPKAIIATSGTSKSLASNVTAVTQALKTATGTAIIPNGIQAPDLGTMTSFRPDSSGVVIPAPSDDTVGPDIVVLGKKRDGRVRIMAGNSTASTAQVLGANDPSSNILSILYETNGLMFPYTPTISVNQAVNWDPISLIQNNFDVHAYQRTPSVALSVNGVFTTQTAREGEYLMAVLHFLRTVTKSYFGEIDRAAGKAGTPPPVLYFDGYGEFMFKSVACVIKSYNYSFEEGVDTNLFVSRSGKEARLPAKMTISMELGVQVNMNKQREQFSLDAFRTGALLSDGGWF